MPTGYTAFIKDNTTFSEFALNCARAFGALVELRDEPNGEIPEEFKPNDYHIKEMEAKRKRLDELLSMDEDAAACAAQKKYENELKSRDQHLSENSAQISGYRKMLKQVMDWEPPTHEHENLKSFMIAQLNSSIEFDGMSDYYEKHPVVKLTGEEWLDKTIKEVSNSISYLKIKNAKEVQRAEERTVWIRELRNSLSSCTEESSC